MCLKGASHHDAALVFGVSHAVSQEVDATEVAVPCQVDAVVVGKLQGVEGTFYKLVFVGFVYHAVGVKHLLGAHERQTVHEHGPEIEALGIIMVGHEEQETDGTHHAVEQHPALLVVHHRHAACLLAV